MFFLSYIPLHRLIYRILRNRLRWWFAATNATGLQEPKPLSISLRGFIEVNGVSSQHTHSRFSKVAQSLSVKERLMSMWDVCGICGQKLYLGMDIVRHLWFCLRALTPSMYTILPQTYIYLDEFGICMHVSHVSLNLSCSSYQSVTHAYNFCNRCGSALPTGPMHFIKKAKSVEAIQ